MSILDLDSWPKDNVSSIVISVPAAAQVAAYSLRNLCGVVCGLARVCDDGERAVNVDYVNSFGGLRPSIEVYSRPALVLHVNVWLLQCIFQVEIT